MQFTMSNKFIAIIPLPLLLMLAKKMLVKNTKLNESKNPLGDEDIPKDPNPPVVNTEMKSSSSEEEIRVNNSKRDKDVNDGKNKRSYSTVNVYHENDIELKCISLCRFLSSLRQLPPERGSYLANDLKVALQERNCGFRFSDWNVGNICTYKNRN
ncbi:hypothetical protein RI129_011782 [Pyrocoelia pectoralis]|uniref:Uncharacterized protein n=1 Tax=Pyrocoelia pectoralis TaxID=417401 RepID=A0AAN7Z812_9COLE